MRIQISPLDYLKSNPNQIQRLVEHYNNKDGGHDSMNANVDHQNKTSTSGTPLVDEDLVLPKLFQREESIILVTSPNQKPNPCLSMEIGWVIAS